MENLGFRAFLMGPDGHVFDRVDLYCDDENVARQKAQELVKDCPVELWQCDRKIATFEPRR
jgi:hypothetical protein